MPAWRTSLRSILLQWNRRISCHLVHCRRKMQIHFKTYSAPTHKNDKVKASFILQNFRCDPVLLPAVERFGVEHDVGTVARLGAGYVALSTQLHPWHSQDRPGETVSGSERPAGSTVQRWHGKTLAHTCRIH